MLWLNLKIEYKFRIWYLYYIFYLVFWLVSILYFIYLFKKNSGGRYIFFYLWNLIYLYFSYVKTNICWWKYIYLYLVLINNMCKKCIAQAGDYDMNVFCK